MYDPGLKSYQHIVIPEYETDDRLSPEEWLIERDRVLPHIFVHILQLQKELDIDLHFEWSPVSQGVQIYTYNSDGKWHSDWGDKNDLTFIINMCDPELFMEDYEDPSDWAKKVIEKMDKWADAFYERNN